MTGAGSATLDHASGRYEAEARSVNHRFLKTSLRTHGSLPVLDQGVEAAVRERLGRGHVNVFVRFTAEAGEATTLVDPAAFAAAAAHLKALANAHGLRDPVLSDVLRLPGVLADGRQAQDAAVLSKAAIEAVGLALDDLLSARRREGKHLKTEVRRLLEAIHAYTGTIATHAGDIPKAVKAKLEARVQELMAKTPLDPAQLAREAAMLAERADVREEISRLEGHVQHARETLDEGGPVGRQLDFLVQEMHREANTIASKSADLELSRTVVGLKADVERLREQVQNLE